MVKYASPPKNAVQRLLAREIQPSYLTPYLDWSSLQEDMPVLKASEDTHKLSRIQKGLEEIYVAKAYEATDASLSTGISSRPETDENKWFDELSVLLSGAGTEPFVTQKIIERYTEGLTHAAMQLREDWENNHSRPEFHPREPELDAKPRGDTLPGWQL